MTINEGQTEIKIYLSPGARLPEKATPGSAGYDIRANLPPDTVVVLDPGERIDIPTGLYFDLPEGVFLTLRPRSGLALNQGLTLLNSPATIDSDYKGELRVIVINLGESEVRIEHEQRIAQLLIEKIVPFQFKTLDVKPISEKGKRGSGGFGSTGLA